MTGCFVLSHLLLLLIFDLILTIQNHRDSLICQVLVNQCLACLSRVQIAARRNVISLMDNGLGFHGRMFEMGSET